MFQLSFVVPGFGKCGTTTLCELLGQHPEIFIPDCKEPWFFSRKDELFGDWYRGLFAGAGSARVLGEGSTMYSVSEFAETACRRLVSHFPEIRLIFIARNPIARLESSFRELHHSGWIFGADADYDIGRTLTKFPNLIADTHYWKLINVYRRAVPDDRILVLALEDLQVNPARELARCFSFLGVDPNVEVSNLMRQSNSAAIKEYDSRLLRMIRKLRWTRKWWDNLPVERRLRLMGLLHLRRPFSEAIRWRPETFVWVREQLEEDCLAFLRFYKLPVDRWNWHNDRTISQGAA